MKFQLLGQEIEISDGRRNYLKILGYYRELARKAVEDFSRDYENTFSFTFFSSSYAEKMSNKYSGEALNKLVMSYVTETRKYLATYGVYTLTDSKIWEALTEDLEGDSRLQDAFDNFIVDLSLKLPDDATDRDFVPKIRSKFESGYFNSFLRTDIMALCDYVTNYLNDNNITEIQFVYEKEAEEAQAIYENLKDTILSEEERVKIFSSIPSGLSQEEFLKECDKRFPSDIPIEQKSRMGYRLIQLDPRKNEYYEYIIQYLPQAKYEIANIANYLGINLTEYIEKDIKASFNLKEISCEEDALRIKEQLEESMSKFGVTRSSRKEELE